MHDILWTFSIDSFSTMCFMMERCCSNVDISCGSHDFVLKYNFLSVWMKGKGGGGGGTPQNFGWDTWYDSTNGTQKWGFCLWRYHTIAYEINV